MTHRPRFSVALFFSLLIACADSFEAPPDGGSEADGGSTVADAGPERDARSDDTCPEGQHRCGGGCIDDLENIPENGCRFGCGEPCPTPNGGAAACTEAGECTISCAPPFFRQGDECVCVAKTCEEIGYTCGAPDDGCGTPLDCGSCGGDGTCIDGTCSCPPDAREPNNNTLGAVLLGTMVDNQNETRTWTDFNLHSARDEDWFKIEIQDKGALGNPVMTVTLDRIPSGSDYDFSVWFTCNSGPDESSCTVGRPCASNNSGTTARTYTFTANCGGTIDEDGTLWIRVVSDRWGGSCEPYRLQVYVTQEFG